MSDVVDHIKAANRVPEFEMLSTGIEGKIIPVGASLIDDVVASIRNPDVPMIMNEEKGREEENPLDPTYIQACKDTDRRRSIAAFETMLIFGLELKEIPPVETWLPRIKLMEKLGHIDLSKYDFDDPMELELIYKKYIAVGTSDLIKIGQYAGLNRRDVEEAAKTFPG